MKVTLQNAGELIPDNYSSYFRSAAYFHTLAENRAVYLEYRNILEGPALDYFLKVKRESLEANFHDYKMNHKEELNAVYESLGCPHCARILEAALDKLFLAISLDSDGVSRLVEFDSRGKSHLKLPI